MDRKAFHPLLKRYLDESSPEAERRLVDQWYELLEDDTPVVLSNADLTALESNLWKGIRQQIARPVDTLPTLPNRRSFWKRLAVAAVVIGLIAGVYWYWNMRQVPVSAISQQVHKNGMLEEGNEGKSSRLVFLEDGSSVRLEPHAKIVFPAHFAKFKREVYLAGEAFFNVTKKPGQPFFVYNNNLVAEVLGTSFNIKMVHNKIEVAVHTGRVAVFENGQQVNLNAQQKFENGVIVTPNQKVTYNPQDRYFVTSLVEIPSLVCAGEDSLTNPFFVFDDTPLLKVLAALEKAYQIEIVLENDNLGKCPFTGDIRKQNLYNKLEVICSVFQANYEIKGTRILIKGGKGCN